MLGTILEVHRLICRMISGEKKGKMKKENVLEHKKSESTLAFLSTMHSIKKILFVRDILIWEETNNRLLSVRLFPERNEILMQNLRCETVNLTAIQRKGLHGFDY